jgi:DNA-binding NarL/FixJ family response regulator
MSRIRVLLADDHTVVRAGLRTLFDADADIEVVAESADGEDAVRRAAELRPDVAVLDFAMPGLNGAAATARLHVDAPAVKVLVLSAYEDPGFLRQVLTAGARGYVLKRAAADELLQAVRVVAGGGVYLEPTLAAHLADRPAEGTATGGGESLSDRERDVLRLLAVGYTNKEIAARLRISVKTVETYKTRGMEKLGLHSRVDIVRFAAHHGWLADV